MFSSAIPVIASLEKKVESFSVDATWLVQSSNLRLDAGYYNPRLAEALDLIKRSGIPVQPLGEVTDKIFIPPRFKRIYVKEEYGIPFLQGRHIPQFQPTDVKYLSKTAQKRLELWIIKSGWVLVTCSGTIGRVTVAPKHWDGWAASQHIMRIIPKEDSPCPSGYLYAFLSSPIGQVQLTSTIYGAVVDEITEDHARGIMVPIPKSKEHRELVSKINYIAIQSVRKKEEAVDLAENAVQAFRDLLAGIRGEDAKIARNRLIEMREHPERLVGGDKLKARLDELLS